MDDIFYMQRCLQLALSGAGHVAPNPMVGAVLVYHDRIIGEGYHRQYGQAHAEVNCLNSVSDADKDLIPFSTLYVSLEPCSHFGHTPPCADLIIRSRIKLVKIGCIDINQKVNGQGVKRLRDAGVTVETGICEKECLDLNKRFFTFHAEKRPFIILKWARSVNGMLGRKGEKTLISGRYTQRIVHKWRSEESAILVGSHTASIDDPLLNNRYWSGDNPTRIVLAGDDIPQNLKLYSEPGNTIVISTSDRNLSGGRTEIKVVTREGYLKEMMEFLYAKKIQSVLVEGGAITTQHFLDAGLWDECRIITNPALMIPDGIHEPLLPAVRQKGQQEVMGDIIRYYINPSQPFVSKE